MYCDYVTRKYGQPHVVVDGYEDYTTKFMTHQRRVTGTVGVDITFTDEMKLSQNKDEFLSMVSQLSCHRIKMNSCL